MGVQLQTVTQRSHIRLLVGLFALLVRLEVGLLPPLDIYWLRDYTVSPLHWLLLNASTSLAGLPQVLEGTPIYDYGFRWLDDILLFAGQASFTVRLQSTCSILQLRPRQNVPCREQVCVVVLGCPSRHYDRFYVPSRLRSLPGSALAGPLRDL